MMTSRPALVILLLSTQLFAVFALQGSYTWVNSFRTVGGGFHYENEGPSLAATYDAVLIHTLLGFPQSGKQEDSKFVLSFENADGGFGASQGGSSDVQSTKLALATLNLLGQTNPAAASKYVNSLFDASSNLFASTAGATGNLKATAFALESLSLLGELESASTTLSAVKKALEAHLKNSKHFSADGESELAAAFYGATAATFAKLSLPADFADHVASAAAKAKTADDLFFAAETLRLLGNTNKVETDAFAAALSKQTADDLHANAAAHAAFAATSLYARNFEFRTEYVGGENTLLEKNARVKHGAPLRLLLLVANKFDGMPHTGFNAKWTIYDDATKVAHNGAYQWDTKNQAYVGQSTYDTTDHLGTLRVENDASLSVPLVGTPKIYATETKQVGYEVAVKSEATFAGKNVRAGESVGLGTDFAFTVTLRDQTSTSINRGPFEVTLKVTDSANVVVFEQTSDRAESSDAIKFAYSLSNAALPAGRLDFVFSVKAKGAAAAHSSETVSYNLGVPMVVTNVAFNDFKANQAATYKLGDKVQIKVDVGTLADLRTVALLDNAHRQNAVVVADLATPSGKHVSSVTGAAKTVGGKLLHVFDIEVQPTFNWIGTHVVTFKYAAPGNPEVRLQNYDSTLNEFADETYHLNFTVKAALQLSLDEKPSATDFHYGNVVSYKFKVKDTTSGSNVFPGTGDANVYLQLKQQVAPAPAPETTTVLEPATVVVKDNKPSSLAIQWAVNPNAAAGAAKASLVVQDLDGNVVALAQEKDTKPYTLSATVSGEIKLSPTIYQDLTSDEASRAVFLVQFTLSCQNKPVKDAQLGALVTYTDRKGNAATLGEAVVVAGAENYEVSWTARHNQAPSGTYKVDFYRYKDLPKVLKGETSQALFSVEVPHEYVRSTGLPIRAEFLVTIVLVVAYMYFSNKKLAYVSK